MFVIIIKVMDLLELNEDIPVITVRVEQFPSGIGEIFQALVAALPNSSSREYYGISFEDESGKFIYQAAATESYPGEGRAVGLEMGVIEKGRYLVEHIPDWRSKDEAIPKAIGALMSQPGFIPGFPCVEKYDHTATDVWCMVRAK